MNAQDIRATYHLLAHQSPVELRMITKDKRIIVETVSTEDEFIKVCQRWDSKAQIYCGMRERRAGFLDGKKKGETANQYDIVAVNLTVVDIDPVRAEEFKKQATTDVELEYATKASEHLARWHEGRGFLRPVRGMSGNGVQLWFAFPRWEVTDENREEIKRALKAFEQEYRDALPDELRDKVTIDSIHDLPRIIKVIGTTSIKGDNTPDRPHRVSHWIDDERLPPKIGREEDEERLDHLQSLATVQPEFEATSDKPSAPKEEEKQESSERTSTTTEHPNEKSPPSALKWQDCEFLMYCEDNARTLSEPLWYAMLSNLSRFGDEGRRLAHQLSQNYPDYSEAETDKKLTHAETASRPITCKSIANKGFKCPLLKQCKAKSPAALLKMNTSGEEKKGPTAEEIAEEYLATENTQDGIPTLKFYREDWWTWNEQRYSEMPKADLEARIARFITDKPNCDVTVNFVSSAVKTLTGQCLVPANVTLPVWTGKELEVTSAGHVVAFENGLLDFDALLRGENVERKSHTPTFFTQIALPYPFDINADCPEWLAFLEHNLEGDNERIAVLQEFVGYCLCWDTRHHKFLLMEGESRTGKSTFTNVVTALLGEDNVTHIPLEMFGQRFALASTLGKLVNITSDVGDLDSVAEGAFKQFIGGDRMNFERKYRDTIFAYPTARVIIAANNRPRFLDRSEAIWERMLLVEWNRVIPEAERDLNLRERIKENELPGIFRWALAGLARLLEQNHFTHSQSVSDAIDDYRLDTNPAREFLVDNYEITEGSFVYTKDIYKEYAQWCEDHGYKPLGERNFSKEIKRAFPKAEPKRQRNHLCQRLRGYEGIGRQR